MLSAYESFIRLSWDYVPLWEQLRTQSSHGCLLLQKVLLLFSYLLLVSELSTH